MTPPLSLPSSEDALFLTALLNTLRLDLRQPVEDLLEAAGDLVEEARRRRVVQKQLDGALEVVRAAYRVRALQREWVRAEGAEKRRALMACKEAERALDELLELEQHPAPKVAEGQTTLFRSVR